MTNYENIINKSFNFDEMVQFILRLTSACSDFSVPEEYCFDTLSYEHRKHRIEQWLISEVEEE